MDYSSATALRVRRIGQKLGVLRPVVRAFRRATGKNYEEAFDAQLMAEIRQGDVVWDIGANIGFYTTKFSDSVGPDGEVLAFEPSPGSLGELRAATSGRSNVQIKSVALSNADGEAIFYSSATGQSVTDGLRAASETDIATSVPVKRADVFLSGRAPNVIKVDVEGYEREVLQGMPETLANPALRAAFIEVHFLESARRGAPNAPAEVTAMLRAAGLDVSWTDPSHIVARRAGK